MLPLCLQIFTVGQQVVFELQGVNLRLVVGTLLVDQGGENKEVQRGVLFENTAFIFTNAGMLLWVACDAKRCEHCSLLGPGMQRDCLLALNMQKSEMNTALVSSWGLLTYRIAAIVVQVPSMCRHAYTVLARPSTTQAKRPSKLLARKAMPPTSCSSKRHSTLRAWALEAWTSNLTPFSGVHLPAACSLHPLCSG